MKNDILLKYRMLNAEEVNREIFKDFIRYQNVTKCWRKENGKWIIKDAPFIDDWIEKDYMSFGAYSLHCIFHYPKYIGLD